MNYGLLLEHKKTELKRLEKLQAGMKMLRDSLRDLDEGVKVLSQHAAGIVFNIRALLISLYQRCPLCSDSARILQNWTQVFAIMSSDPGEEFIRSR